MSAGTQLARIVIAENDPTSLNTLKEAFEDEGYLVLAASNVTRARRLLKDKLFDVAVLDLRLDDDHDPRDISGLELAKQINKEIPKIIISSYPTLEVLREALRGSLGSPPDVDFIGKGESPERLLESIRTLTDSKRAAESHHTAIDIIGGQSTSLRRLRVFLCHSSANKSIARDLYQRLEADGADPWLDEKKLLPGHDWQMEIEKAVRKSDMVIVSLSRASVSNRGYIQKEIRIALDVADEQPDGTIFIVPLKLEQCEIPDRLRRWQWVNYFEPDAYEKLLLSIKHRASEISTLESTNPS